MLERQRELLARPDPEWQETLISVDGSPTSFLRLIEGPDWVARGEVEGRTLNLRSRGFSLDRVDLVTVDPSRTWRGGGVIWRKRAEARAELQAPPQPFGEPVPGRTMKTQPASTNG